MESKAAKRTYQTHILRTFSRVSVSPWSSVSSFDWCLFIDCGHVVFLFMLILKWRHKLVFSYCHYFEAWCMDSVEKLIHLYSATIFFASNERGMAYICYLLFLRTIILPSLISFVMHAWRLNLMYNLLSTKY